MNWGLLAQQDPGSWIDLLDRGGLVIGLILALWGFTTRRVISRGTYDEVREERDHWRSVALHALGLGEKAVDVAKEKP